MADSTLAEYDERQIAATALTAAENNLQSLCASHAATFVAVETRGAALASSLKKLLSALNDAEPLVGESKSSLELDEGDESNLNMLAEKHRLRRRTLLQHSSLLELLELPSLMDACVRGHLYEEALSIAGFANTLERRHFGLSMSSSVTDEGSKNPVVQNVIYEVRRRESDLRRHLLHRLRSDVTMPQCLEVVSALRRLNGVELERSSRKNSSNMDDVEKLHGAMEWRLKVDFLEARDGFLIESTATATGPASVTIGKSKGLMTGKSEQLLDSIDIYRTRCFEIATQFLAIFRSSTSKSVANNSISQLTTSGLLDPSLQLLSMWTTRRIQMFLTHHLASHHLSLIKDSSTLRDALDSATFFATSMGRIGADFSSLLLPIFEPRLVEIIRGHWSDGVTAFGDTLKVCREAGVASPLYSDTSTPAVTLGTEDDVIDPLLSSYDGEDLAVTKKSIAPDHYSKTPLPPRQLLSLPPLARLVNSFLTGLNELRRCLLPNIFPTLRRHFKQLVQDIKSILGQNERAVLAPGFLSWKGEEAGKLRSVAVDLKAEFDMCVEPYLENSLEVAFGIFHSVPSTSADQNESKVEEVDKMIAEADQGLASVSLSDEGNHADYVQNNVLPNEEKDIPQGDPVEKEEIVNEGEDHSDEQLGELSSSQ